MRLRDWRQKSGLTQHQLAERVGVTQAAVSNYERGVIPKKEEAIKFYLLSGGDVQPNDFYDLPPLLGNDDRKEEVAA